MIKRLQQKFIVVTMCSIATVLLFLVLTINIVNYYSVVKEADELTQMLVENDGKFPRGDKNDVLGSVLPKPSENTTESKWTIETPYETRFFSVTFDENKEITLTETGNIKAISAEDAEILATSLLEETKEIGFEQNYRYRVAETSTGYLVVFVDCTKQMKSIQNYLGASLMIAAIAFISVFLLILLFSKKAIRPIAESYEKQKQFITDSNHEIKTPLAVIQANTELLEIMNGENQWTTSIKNQVKRLTSLIENLTALSRMDEEGKVIEKQKGNLSELVKENVQMFLPMIEQKEKALITHIEDGIVVSYNESQQRQLLSILLENAIKYGNKTIEVSLEKKKGKVILTIENDCNNIEIGKLDAWFERFYREDKSRSQTIKGFGIGLSIAKSIVEEHKGTIKAWSEDGEHVKIAVSYLR